jgi:hypothetical protein
LAAIWREFSAIDSGSIKWLFCDKLLVRGVRHCFACRVEGWERWGASRPIPLVYQELDKRAHHYLRAERPGRTLQSTALVHEASGKGLSTLAESKEGSRAMMQEACADAPLSRAMVFRLLAKYREDRRLSAVLLHPRGRKRSSGGLREEQELIITGQILKFYLTRERRPLAALSRLGPLERRRGYGAYGQALGSLQGNPHCGRAHSSKSWADAASFWRQSVSGRHRHAQQLLPWRPGVSHGNLRWRKICGSVHGRAGSASRIRWVFRLRTDSPGNIERYPMGPLLQRASRLSGRGSMFRNDGPTAIRARGYVGRPWG